MIVYAQRVVIDAVVLRRVEFDRCTSHGKRIAEVLTVRATSGSEITLDPPILVHIDRDPFDGANVIELCPRDEEGVH